MAISKKEALNAQGKLKKGYYFDLDGTLRKAKKPVRTKLYTAAAKLGRAGGRATARKQRKLF